MNYKKNIAQAISRELNVNLEIIEQIIEIPPKVDMGDFSFPCFKLSKIIKKPPDIIAKELKEKLHIDGFERVESLNSYLNFFIDKNIFMKDVLEKINMEGDCYGSSNIGEGKCICIEYFSPDITKPLYIEQLFNVVIGNSLCNLFKKSGYIVKNLIKTLNLNQYEEVSRIFNVNFELEEEESFYNNKFNFLLEILINKGVVNEIDGSKIIMLNKFNLPPYIILKNDKFNTYSKLDLEIAICRKNKYDFYKWIYVSGRKMKTQFKQMFSVLELAGYEWVENCLHARVGLIRFNNINEEIRYIDGILLNDVIREAIDRILHIINIENSNLNDIKEIAKKIGIGVIRFTCLKKSREKNILLDWEEMLSLEKGTYLYIQYSYAKAINILEKNKNIKIKTNLNKLSLKEEFELIKYLEKFNIIINDAIENLEPSILLLYIVEVTEKMNNIFNIYSIANTQDKELINFRLALIKATCQVLNNALDLIGIEVIEELNILYKLRYSSSFA